MVINQWNGGALNNMGLSGRDRTRFPRTSSPGLAWTSALLLPCLSTAAVAYLPLLDRIPAAFFLCSIALTASFGSVLPVVCAGALSIALYNYYLASPRGHWSLAPEELVREVVLILVAAAIAALIIRFRRMEAALGEREALYRTTLAGLGEGVIVTDLEGNITLMNPVAETLTGWSEAEVKHKPLASFFRISKGSASGPAADSAEAAVAADGQTTLQRRDGTLLPIDESVASIRGQDGLDAGAVLVFRDARARRDADAAHNALLERARAAEAELREALDAYKDQVQALALAQQAGKSASWILDVSALKVKFFPGGFEIFGIPFDELGDRPPISFVEPEYRPGIMAAVARTVEEGALFQPEFQLRWPNGEMHWQEARGVRDSENPNLIRGTTFDITERKLADLALLRVEKLAAVGRIASTIAHEINNPLAAVTNLLFLSLLDPCLDPQTRIYLLTAEEELSRLSSITRLTLSYARSQDQVAEVDPATIIDRVLTLFRIRLDAKGVRTERICTEPVILRVCVEELERVITNLLANAIDAVGLSDSRIRIGVRQQQAHVLLSIEDNGIGIPPERAGRIFDPFFTTKEEVGTGIGLWVTKELVEKNGGSITFVSGELDDGMRTRFEVRLPAAG